MPREPPFDAQVVEVRINHGMAMIVFAVCS
jgi:hypothetical protein